MLGLSASLLDWHWDFWPVPLFSPPVKGEWQVGVFGKPHECLENAVRAAPALGQQGGNPSAETPGHHLQLPKLKSQNRGSRAERGCYLLLLRAGGCQQFKLLCCETLYGAGQWK